MTNIPGLTKLLRYVGNFVTWTYEMYIDPVTEDLLDGPIFTVAGFVLDNAVVFIFVVAVPLVGLGIGLLRRMLNS